jgi:hypothetical protein
MTAAPELATEVAAILKEAAKTPPPPAVLRIVPDDGAASVTIDGPGGTVERWRIEHVDDERLATLRELDKLAVLLALALAHARRAAA